jgi:hypothetical protein
MEVQAPVRNIFPFSHKPNTLDRDRIVVPAGWDSWGKIAVLRDGFDAKMWGEAWERDLDAEDGEPGAKKTYANLVPDQGSKVSRRRHPLSLRILTCLPSRRRFHPSTIRHQSKHSLQKIMTKIPRNPTETLVVLLEIHKTWPVRLLELLALWEAAVSIFQTSRGH